MRPRARNELRMVVRPLTMVNSRLDAWEVERTVVTQSDRSAEQGTTMAPATGRPRVPLTVCVGGAGNIQLVYRTVPYPVSSVQTVTRPAWPSQSAKPFPTGAGFGNAG